MYQQICRTLKLQAKMQEVILDREIRNLNAQANQEGPQEEDIEFEEY